MRPTPIHNGGAVTSPTLSTTITGTDATLFSTSSDTCNGHSVAAMSSCTLTVLMMPTTVGAKNATLTVGGGGKSVSVPLSGTVVLPGALSITPSAPGFGTVGMGSSGYASVTVQNTGGATLASLATSIAGANFGDFSFSTDNCAGKNLPAGASCGIALKFQPTAVGHRTATLSVGPSSGPGAATGSLAGDATAHLKVVLDTTWCSGAVVTADRTINCGSACDADFSTDPVTLTAQLGTRDDSPCYVDTWSSSGSSTSGCGPSGSCGVHLTAPTVTVTATFTPKVCIDPVSGSDGGRGTCASPFKTITHGTGATFASGDKIQLRPGTYSAATNGETFPVIVPADVKLVGDEATKGLGSGAGAVYLANLVNTPTFTPSSRSVIAGVKCLSSGTDILVQTVTGAQILNNTLNGATGIYVDHSTDVSIVENDISNNSSQGVRIYLSSAKLEHNRVRLGNVGVSIEMSPSSGNVDLGSGAYSSAGHNILSGNTGNNLQVNNYGSAGLFAENDCWDNSPPSYGDFDGADIFNYTPGQPIYTNGNLLATSPNCPFP